MTIVTLFLAIVGAVAGIVALVATTKLHMLYATLDGEVTRFNQRLNGSWEKLTRQFGEFDFRIRSLNERSRRAFRATDDNFRSVADTVARQGRVHEDLGRETNQAIHRMVEWQEMATDKLLAHESAIRELERVQEDHTSAHVLGQDS